MTDQVRGAHPTEADMEDKDRIYYKRKLTGRLKEISDLQYRMAGADREETEQLAAEIRRLNDEEAKRHVG